MIRSIQGTSLIEFPGKIASVLFSAGCNYACPFCHNPELVNPGLLDGELSISHREILEELIQRRGFIDGVVLTGGEPLFHRDNIDLLRRIKEETGLAVKLDTNGSYPGRLEEALPFVDYVAMDLKASPENYIFATGGRGSWEPVAESAGLIMESGKPCEFRTTMVPGVVNAEDVMSILRILKPGKPKKYVLQRFRSEKTLSDELKGMPSYPGEYLQELADSIRDMAEEVQLRI